MMKIKRHHGREHDLERVPGADLVLELAAPFEYMPGGIFTS